MSLLQEAMEDCVKLNETTISDGYGGFIVEYTEAEKMQTAIVFDSSLEARTAEKSGVTSLYTITTSREVILKYHDVIKRISDGKVFRITSDGDDRKTPMSSSLNMRQVTAEEWRIDNG